MQKLPVAGTAQKICKSLLLMVASSDMCIEMYRRNGLGVLIRVMCRPSKLCCHKNG